MLRRYTAPLLTLLGLLFAALTVAGCTFPRDPENTLENIKESGTLRVGVIDNPPWVDLSGPEPKGVEITLIEDFAERIGADRIEYKEGTESELIGALDGFQLDLVAGGLSRTGAWAKEVALSRPFIGTEIIVAYPPGGPDEVPADDLSGMDIQVERGSHPAAFLRQEEDDANPIFFDELDELRGTDTPALIHTYEAEELGWVRTDYILSDTEHAIAAPPGENNFLVELDEFLLNSEQRTERLLLEEVTK